MTRLRLVVPVLALTLATAAPARAGEGFLIGLEYGGGWWSANKAELAAQLDAAGTAASPEVAAEIFTTPLDTFFRQNLNFHFGWNVKGYESIELAMQTSFWSPLDDSESFGVGLVGLRFTTYPLQYWFPDREFDAGIELGGGYSVGGGHTPLYGRTWVSGMRGPYYTFGLTGEWSPTKWFTLALQLRHFTNLWATYVHNWNAGQTSNTPDFSAGYTTIGLATTFHFGVAQ